MIYSVPAMNRVRWYDAGAAAILRAQQADGSWMAGQPSLIPGITSDINTCFALLFLKRSNIARDLTANLLRKPNQSTMRSGDAAAPTVPESTPTTEAERLARELPAAAPIRQDAIINKLRDGKGTEFTEALAHVIPQLTGVVQKNARDALAERLARMTPATIRSKLKDANAEIRRAATLACAMKEDKTFIADLIAALDDRDVWVVRGAGVALRLLTGQDFGPTATATVEERSKAVAAWKAWWKSHKGAK
jgi:hypothetical protein